MTSPAKEPRDAAGPTVPSLTDFLLARIQEDQDAAERWTPATGDDEVSAHFNLSLRRVLADCAARRAIVELWDETRRSAMLSGPAGGDESIIEDGALTEGLRLLASVYADHPDFDPAWRLP